MKTDVPRYTMAGTPKRLRINPEFAALWEPYLDDGMAAKHVAEIFGVCEKRVRQFYPDKVWTHAQAVEHGLAVKNLNAKMRAVTYV